MIDWRSQHVFLAEKSGGRSPGFLSESARLIVFTLVLFYFFTLVLFFTFFLYFGAIYFGSYVFHKGIPKK